MENGMNHKFPFEHDPAMAWEKAPVGRIPKPCATPDCHGVVADPWESEGLYCPECAIERDLFDREARWEHLNAS
jgi:hypothetical protein